MLSTFPTIFQRRRKRRRGKKGEEIENTRGENVEKTELALKEVQSSKINLLAFLHLLPTLKIKISS